MIRVRRAELDDEVLTLDRECFAGEPWYTAESDEVWVAHDGTGALVAYAGARPSEHYHAAAYLSRAGVHPDHRGRGLQQRLIQARVAWARRAGFRSVVTYTRDNPASGNALIACGFRLFEPLYTFGLADERWFRRVLP